MIDGTLLTASALEQAAYIRRGHLSSEELTSLYLNRIERHNPSIAAFLEVHPERALWAARCKDKDLRRKGFEPPPFHGVPTGIKDINFVRGMFTRMGSRAFCVFSPIDDLLTRQVRAGGFVILGKTTTSEFGVVSVVEPERGPPTRNPWNLAHTAGGSSGGAGAAVAAGLVPIAPGSDGAGSIRIPSAFCHLVGLKPSRGRVANAFREPDQMILYTDGPMCRTVTDTAALLDLLAGITCGRVHWAPPPPEPFSQLLHHPQRPLRIRLVTTTPMGSTDAEVLEAIERVARALTDVGHHIEPGPPPRMNVEEFMPIWQHMASQAPVSDWSLAHPITRWLAEAGRQITDSFAMARRNELRQRILDWFGDAEAMLTPTIPCTPDEVGAFRDLPVEESFMGLARYGYFTAIFNLSGQPAVTVPAGLSRDGLPMGAQLIGVPFDEATVLRLAAQVEEALPWRPRHTRMLLTDFGNY